MGGRLPRPKPNKTILGAGLLTIAAASLAPKSEFGGMRATGFSMGKEVPTDCSINMKIGDKMYCFSGDQPKQMFVDDQKKMLMKAEENFTQMSMMKKYAFCHSYFVTALRVSRLSVYLSIRKKWKTYPKAPVTTCRYREGISCGFGNQIGEYSYLGERFSLILVETIGRLRPVIMETTRFSPCRQLPYRTPTIWTTVSPIKRSEQIP